jgi:excisionase family DNA binding protein
MIPQKNKNLRSRTLVGRKKMKNPYIEQDEMLSKVMEMFKILESMEEVLLTPMQVAKLLGLSYNTVWKYIREGKIRAYKVGERYRIPLKEALKLKKIVFINTKVR